jgi:hypothetical protein
VLTTKVKGMGLVPINMKLKRCGASCNSSKYFHELTSLRNDTNYQILDSTDYTIPSNEHNTIFIMTNFIRTEQTRGLCDEELTKINSKCKSHKDCKNLGSFVSSWNGIPTGNCIKSSIRTDENVCEVSGWCPNEHDVNR